MNAHLKIGDRVMLCENSRFVKYNPYSECNPTDVMGTVDDLPKEGDDWVGVQWDNGYHNAYRPYDSDLILQAGE